MRQFVLLFLFHVFSLALPNRYLDIIFDTDLSAPDKTTLDGIVAAHTGTPEVAPENAILMADGSGRLKYDVVQATDIEGLETEVEAYSGAYPRRYITSTLTVNVKDWAQYVVHHGKLEVAGTLELGDGGMLIIRET